MSSGVQWDRLVRQLYSTYYPDIQELTLPCLHLWVTTRWVFKDMPWEKPLEEWVKKANPAMDEVFRLLNSHVTDQELIQVTSLPPVEPTEIEIMFQTYMDQQQRSSTGSYFTPEGLAAFMVREAIGAHFRAHVSDKGQKWFDIECFRWAEKPDEDVTTELWNWYETLNLLDLSCGGGVFLRQGFRQLSTLGQLLNSKVRIRKSSQFLMRHVMEKKLTGLEKQFETAFLAELLLKAQLPRDLRLNATPQIHCTDALNWPMPADHDKFQLILGNPPYVGEKGNRALFLEVKQTNFGKSWYEKNMDFSYFFLHKGLDLLAPKGVLCYVTTSYFATADGALKLRSRLKEEVCFHWLVYPEMVTLFPQAKGQHNLIYCLSRRGQAPCPAPRLLHVSRTMDRDTCLQRLWQGGIDNFGEGAVCTVFSDDEEMFDQRNQLLIRTPGRSRKCLQQLEGSTHFQLQDLCTINQGLVSGADKFTIRHQRFHQMDTHEPGEGIFVLNRQEMENLVTEDPSVGKVIKPFFKNSQIWPYRTEQSTNQWILYLTDAGTPDIRDYPVLEKHLKPYRQVLEKRREVAMGIRCWHSLHWPRNARVFEQPKIVSPQRASLNIFALSEEPWYASADVYYIQRTEACFYSLKYLLAWLNSSLCYAWLSHYGKMKGKDLELYATPLKSIPVPPPPGEEEERWMEEQVDRILELGRGSAEMWSIQQAMDLRFMDWIGISPGESSELQGQAASIRKSFSRRGP